MWTPKNTFHAVCQGTVREGAIVRFYSTLGPSQMVVIEHAGSSLFPSAEICGVALERGTQGQTITVACGEGSLVGVLCAPGSYTAGAFITVGTSDAEATQIAYLGAACVGVVAATATLAAAGILPVMLTRRGGLFVDNGVSEISAPIDGSAIGTTTVTPSWQLVSYQNSWVDYGASAVSRYLKNGFGDVHFEVRMKSGVNGVSAFTFPAGYRPGQACSIVGQTLAGTIACADLAASGTFTPTVSSAGGVFYRGIFPAEN